MARGDAKVKKELVRPEKPDKPHGKPHSEPETKADGARKPGELHERLFIFGREKKPK